MPTRVRTIPACVLALLVGCSAGEAGDRKTTFDTSGDTIVARTGPARLGDSVPLVREISIGQAEGAPEYGFSTISDLAVGKNGEIYVWDNQEKALRLYDAQGKFVRQIGRTGAGPGEYDRINGIAVRSDGKLGVWDAGNGRINIYAPNGDFETTWKLSSGFFTSRAMLSDTANSLYIRATVRRDSTQPFGTTGYIRFNPDGVPTDSLVPPAIGPEPQYLSASNSGGMSVRYGIPYLPSRQWAMSPFGYFVAGPGDPYVIYALPSTGKPIKIVRNSEPVPVSAEEKAESKASTLWGMRLSFPDYQWNGPDIPDHKPAYRTLTIDMDGRIWVAVSQPGERIPESEMPPPSVGIAGQGTGDRPAPPRRTWREPMAYDVFAPTGEYLGHVKVPPRTTFYAMRGNQVWGVTLDSLDLPTITRYRIGGDYTVNDRR